MCSLCEEEPRVLMEGASARDEMANDQVGIHRILATPFVSAGYPYQVRTCESRSLAEGRERRARRRELKALTHRFDLFLYH